MFLVTNSYRYEGMNSEMHAFPTKEMAELFIQWEIRRECKIRCKGDESALVKALETFTVRDHEWYIEEFPEQKGMYKASCDKTGFLLYHEDRNFLVHCIQQENLEYECRCVFTDTGCIVGDLVYTIEFIALD